MLGVANTTFQDRLQRWHIAIDSRPVETTAKVLKAPTIRFKNQNARTNNGSFNLNNLLFSKPAKLQSFVLMNFSKNKKKSHECMELVLRVAEKHGLVIPSMIMDITKRDRSGYSYLLDQVSVDYEGRDAVGDVS